MNQVNINENNYRVVKAQIGAIRKQLEKEMTRNYDSIKALEKRQDEIKNEYESFTSQMEQIGEFELESEYKFLQQIERKCKRCKKVFDKRKSPSKNLCPECFTSNA